MIFLFRSDVGRRPTHFCCVCAPAPLSEPVRRFSSCSTDFSQQIAQVVLFLFLGRPCVSMWTGDCALYLRGCACRKMAGMKGVNDDDIARWIFEDSEVEGEFSDESEHEETLPVCSDISSSGSESSDDEEGDDNTQPVTSSWKVYRDGDCGLIKFPYSVTQQGFTLPQSAWPKTELEYFQLFFSDDLIGKIVTATNVYAAGKIQTVTPLTKYSMWHSWKNKQKQFIYFI